MQTSGGVMSKAQELFIQAIEALEVGESLTAGPQFTGTQWTYILQRASATRVDAIICNVDANGVHWFCDVTTIGHPYGLPMVVEEPSLGVLCADCGLDAEGNVVGAIVLNGNNDSIRRASWSRIVKAEKGAFKITSESELLVNGVSEGFILGLIASNKNRITGWIAIVAPARRVGPPLLLEVQSLTELAAKKGFFGSC